MADRPAATPDFTFFESVAALAAWDACDANPLHISNTPLLTRTTAGPPADGSSPEKASSTRMLVCHDFKGGYHAYEGPQGIVSAETVYTCEYLQFVDIFVYFAHKRVAIPPAAWINYMHKNGVKVLGTFIVEGDNGSSELREIFQPETENTVYHAGHYANQLASIAETYGFDGWLLNFESRFPREIFDFPIFSSWLDYLRDELHRLVPGSQLMWYGRHMFFDRIRPSV